MEAIKRRVRRIIHLLNIRFRGDCPVCRNYHYPVCKSDS